MSIHDHQSVANIKNRAERCQLKNDLLRIEREKQDVLRMLNTEKRRFKSKYSKIFRSELLVNEPQEVKMYETHNPGFCYRRNGEHKIPQNILSNPSVDYEVIKPMLFTNGELDIEKILCLYLLSAHKTETLTPPHTYRKVKPVSKEHSPVERLIERSKRRMLSIAEDKLIAALPLYILETPMSPSKELSANRKSSSMTLINDGRLANRVLLNEKLFELLYTVFVALEHSHSEKLPQILEMAFDTSTLKLLFQSTRIQTFLQSLQDLPIITSCESYVLTPPFKVKTRALQVRTLSGSLEQLVTYIHQNVLQIFSRKTWQKLHEAPINEEVPKSSPTVPLFQSSYPRLNKPKMEKSDKMSAELYVSSFSTITTPKRDTSSPKRSSLQEESGKILGRHIKRNYIAANIEAAATYKRIEYDREEEDDLKTRRSSQDSRRSNERRRSSIPHGVPKLNIPTTVIENVETSPDVRSKKEQLDSIESFGHTHPGTSTNESHTHRRKSSIDSDDLKYHLKQTTCPACMERWRTPLPSPKTPRIKRNSTSSSSTTQNLKTNSRHRISSLIDKELYKLQSYDRKYSSDSSRRSSIKKDVVAKYSVDSVELNSLDLAKIKHEIKQKETQKKLEDFLKET